MGFSLGLWCGALFKVGLGVKYYLRQCWVSESGPRWGSSLVAKRIACQCAAGSGLMPDAVAAEHCVPVKRVNMMFSPPGPQLRRSSVSLQPSPAQQPQEQQRTRRMPPRSHKVSSRLVPGLLTMFTSHFAHRPFAAALRSAC